jgi:hypothetical protein
MLLFLTGVKAKQSPLVLCSLTKLLQQPQGQMNEYVQFIELMA